MLQTAFFYLLLYLLSLSFLFCSGFFLLRLFKTHLQIEGAFTKIFVSCFIGLVSCVIVFSILKAKANTINFVLLVIFGFLFYKNKLILSTNAQKGRFTANRTTLAIAFTGLIILPFIYFCCVADTYTFFNF